MDNIILDLPYTFICLDDILVSIRTAADHPLHLSTVLRLLQQNGRLINGEK
jgi:hypothetical protein